MSETLHVYIGWDARESVAWHVLSHSILARSTMPVAIHPIKLAQLPCLTRPRDPRQSNDFSFSRFLAPWLNGHEGWCLFLDADMLCRADIAELFALRDEDKAVQVVKHCYTPKYQKKYLGARQYVYQRKNWSSVMLFNCSHRQTTALTPSLVNVATGEYLHQFGWCSDDVIGELPVEWNHLVEEYDENPDAKIVHWTNFGPWLDGHHDVEFAPEWRMERGKMLYAMQEGVQ